MLSRLSYSSHRSSRRNKNQSLILERPKFNKAWYVSLKAINKLINSYYDFVILAHHQFSMPLNPDTLQIRINFAFASARLPFVA